MKDLEKVKGLEDFFSASINFIDTNPEIASVLRDLARKAALEGISEAAEEDEDATLEALENLEYVAAVVEAKRPVSEVGKKLFDRLLPLFLPTQGIPAETQILNMRKDMGKVLKEMSK